MAPGRASPLGPEPLCYLPRICDRICNNGRLRIPEGQNHFKYRPDLPERFGSIQDARAYCHGLSPWYNTEHPHSGLGLLTPYDVHYGLAEQRVSARAAVLTVVYTAHPERFPAGQPHPPARPVEVWINPPNILVPVQTSAALPTSPLAHPGAFA